MCFGPRGNCGSNFPLLCMDLASAEGRLAAGVEEDDEDVPELSGRTLEVLRDFLLERKRATEGEAVVAEKEREEEVEDVRLVTEDWRLSQFWYDRSTAEALVHEIRYLSDGAAVAPRVACISCPTLFAYLKNSELNISVRLLEYDRRFEQYGEDYVFYDYNQPTELPQELMHSFNILVADPPYLSKECLEKVAETISFLSCSSSSYILLLTGAVQRENAMELLQLHPCDLRPQHSNKLGNEFMLFTSYNPGERLGGWEI